MAVEQRRASGELGLKRSGLKPKRLLITTTALFRACFQRNAFLPGCLLLSLVRSCVTCHRAHVFPRRIPRDLTTRGDNVA